MSRLGRIKFYVASAIKKVSKTNKNTNIETQTIDEISFEKPHPVLNFSGEFVSLAAFVSGV